MPAPGRLKASPWDAALARLERLLRSRTLLSGDVLECLEVQQLRVPHISDCRTRQRLVKCGACLPLPACGLHAWSAPATAGVVHVQAAQPPAGDLSLVHHTQLRAGWWTSWSSSCRRRPRQPTSQGRPSCGSGALLRRAGWCRLRPTRHGWRGWTIIAACCSCLQRRPHCWPLAWPAAPQRASPAAPRCRLTCCQGYAP